MIEGRYRLRRLLGEGAVAQVWAADDLLLERSVAIKLLRRGANAGSLERELQALARLAHPGIVRLFDAGVLDGRPYLVMERVRGPSLADLLIDGPMPPEWVQVIGRELAAALAHAHAAGLVHRDVTPRNVLLDEFGCPRLTDFGIAGAIGSIAGADDEVLCGTPAYAAPEQLATQRVSPAADVFALGMVLREVLVGPEALPPSTLAIAVRRLRTDPVIPDGLPHPWPELLRAMTARDPNRRPLAAQVAACLAGGGPVAILPQPPDRLGLPETAPPPAAPRSRRAPVAAAAATLGVLLLAQATLGSGAADTPRVTAAVASPTALDGHTIALLAAQRPLSEPTETPAPTPEPQPPPALPAEP